MTDPFKPFWKYKINFDGLTEMNSFHPTRLFEEGVINELISEDEAREMLSKHRKNTDIIYLEKLQ